MAVAEFHVTYPSVFIGKGASTTLNAADVVAALYPPLLAYSQFLGAPEPEDLVQDTLEEMHLHPSKAVEFPQVLAYAKVVMKNLNIDQHRERERHVPTVAYDEAVGSPEDLDRCQVCGSYDARCACCG